MTIKEQVRRIGPNHKYKYELPQINPSFEQPAAGKPLHGFLLTKLNETFDQAGDQVTVVGRGEKFPKGAQVAFRFAEDLGRERGPAELYGRHEKPRNHKKAIYIFTTPHLPESFETDQQISSWMRGILVSNACHDAVVVEGKSEEERLREGARAFITSMEGNVGVEIFHGEGEDFFRHLTERFKLLGGAEMVNKKESQVTEKLTFEDWCQRKVVQDVAYASRLLGRQGLLWDLDLKQYASRRQVERILFTLKQAGLGEGNLSAIDRDFRLMAITETGVSKPRINPYKGEVVAVPEVTENGTVHLVTRGLPEGHPINLFKHPSPETFKDTLNFFVSSLRRGKMGQLLKDSLVKGANIQIDHPPSIEANENGLFYMADALYHVGQVSTFEEFLQYLNSGFAKSRTLPVLPEGLDAAADAAVHIHKVPKISQDPRVKIVPLDLERFNFRHSPPCGSREGFLLLLSQVFKSYEIYGRPESPDEIRGVILPGHGSFLWGYRGIKSLADGIVGRVEFNDHVPQF